MNNFVTYTLFFILIALLFNLPAEAEQDEITVGECQAYADNVADMVFQVTSTKYEELMAGLVVDFIGKCHRGEKIILPDEVTGENTTFICTKSHDL